MLFLKTKLGKWRAKKCGMPTKLSSANKEYLKVIYLKKYGEGGYREELTRDLRDASDPSSDPFLFDDVSSDIVSLEE